MSKQDILTEAMRSYRMHVVGHRLRKFGFEYGINHLSTDDLCVLRNMVYSHQKEAIDREIYERNRLLIPSTKIG